MVFERELNLAIDAVRRAGLLARKVQESMIGDGTIIKEDKSPVTVADYSVQALICHMIKETFPDDDIVGEENSGDLSDVKNADILSKITSCLSEAIPGIKDEDICRLIDLGGGQPKGRFWTLDPIDGTKGFIRQDQYAIALALIEDGEVVAGALACPNLEFNVAGYSETGSVFAAARGEGAFMSPLDGGADVRISVSNVPESSNAKMVESVEAAHGNHSGQSALARSLGITNESVRMDSQAKYGAVARGEAELYIRMPSPKTPDYREKIWDHGAGKIVVEEAGGRVTDIAGKELDFTKGRKLEDNRGVLVSNGLFHDKIVEAIGKG